MQGVSASQKPVVSLTSCPVSSSKRPASVVGEPIVKPPGTGTIKRKALHGVAEPQGDGDTGPVFFPGRCPRRCEAIVEGMGDQLFAHGNLGPVEGVPVNARDGALPALRVHRHIKLASRTITGPDSGRVVDGRFSSSSSSGKTEAKIVVAVVRVPRVAVRRSDVACVLVPGAATIDPASSPCDRHPSLPRPSARSRRMATEILAAEAPRVGAERGRESCSVTLLKPCRIDQPQMVGGSARRRARR